jgi:hypothetical protein
VCVLVFVTFLRCLYLCGDPQQLSTPNLDNYWVHSDNVSYPTTLKLTLVIGQKATTSSYRFCLWLSSPSVVSI